MSSFVLIGGKNKDSQENKIESEILKMTGKEEPVVLFCPYAVTELKKASDKFKMLMKNLKCRIMDMTMENIGDFNTMLNAADVLYISGGVSDHLVKIFQDYHLDLILRKYLDSDKIFAGSSAGAMLFTVISMGDKDMFTDNYHNYNYKMVHCLGILNISICPHYQNEDLILYNDEIKKVGLDSFGIEEDTALVIQGNKFSVLKDFKYRSVYYFPKETYQMIPLYEGEFYEKDSSFRS